uniref:Uncharacterized protein n=1 Tax=Anguilla anguilla TaxID=7936 RepID=A0A0E9QB86_ANGAN
MHKYALMEQRYNQCS